MMKLREFIDCYLLGRNRLEAIGLLPLGCTFDAATALYGVPLETETKEEAPEIKIHTFTAGPYHKVVAEEWQGTIQLLTYWSHKPDPGRDLARYLEFHGQGIRWNVMEAGFWYQRSDAELRIWCSMAPAIGVAYVKFLLARSEFKRAWEIKQLDSLKDPTWASDDAIFDLQKRFVTRESTALLDFVRRNDRIVASSDGREVIIVRDHHAFDRDDGFTELNQPPNLATGYATQVINFFHMAETGAHWSKAPLPRDAVVDHVRCLDGNWHVQIRRTTTGRTLTFAGSIRKIRSLCGTIISAASHKDEKMWAVLENLEQNWAKD